MAQISVIDYGVGNLRSVKQGFERAGARVLITHNPQDLVESDAIVLPGVGAFREALRNLTALSETLRQSAKDEKPIFGICLGLQVLFSKSYEDGFSKGLDLIPGEIVKLPSGVKLPQIGWNTLEIVKPHALLEGVATNSYVYFVHTYIPQPTEQEIILATTEYGTKFPSVIAKNNLLATQFHPEKSGKIGGIILGNFLNIVKK